MEIPFEQPYKGPYRLPNNRIAYTQDTLEEYPLLKEAGIKPGIYPIDSSALGNKSTKAIDISNYGFIAPSMGTVRVLVLKVEFDGQEGLPGWPNSEINRALFQPNSDKPGGSLRDYYYRQSQGQLNLIGDIYPQDNTYYHLPGSPTLPLTVTAANSLLNQADADGINFQDYDADNSGKIDALLILYKVNFREFVGPFWNDFGSAAQRDDVQIFRASFLAHEVIEDYNHFIAFHEFGHILGLPDLYDYGGDYEGRNNPGPDGDESTGNGWWELMAAGNYTWPPQNLSAVSKYILGWEQPINLTSNVRDLRVYPVEGGTNRIYRIWKNGDIGPEYFLIENRSTSGQWLYKSPGVYPSALYLNFFSSGLDLRNLPSGLLIWHVDETVFNEVGNYGFGCNDYEERKFIDLEECSATYTLTYQGKYIVDRNDNPPAPIYATYFGGTYDPWPQTLGGTTYDAFTHTTIPNSDAYDNPNPGIAITNIRRDGQDILVDISIGAPDLELSLPRRVFSGNISITPSLANNVSRVDYYFGGNPIGTVSEAPFSFELDTSNLVFGSYELKGIAFGEATEITDEAKVQVIVDNTRGAFPLMETFDLPTYQVAGSAFDFGNPFSPQFGGYNASPSSFGIHDPADNGYRNNLRAILVLPLIDLTDAANPTLVFKQHYNIEDGADFISVVVSTDGFGSDFTVAKTRGGRDATYTGFRQDWQNVGVNLAPWVGQKVHVGFLFESDADGAGQDISFPAGWWVDNIVVAEDYAESVPFITSASIEDGSLYGLVPGKPEITANLTAINGATSILYKVVGLRDSIQGEIPGPPFDVVIPIGNFRNQQVDLILEPKDSAGVVGPSIVKRLFLFNLRGDTNSDGVVNDDDLAQISLNFGLMSTSSSYLPWLDTNLDNIVDERDISAIGFFYQDSIP